MGETDVASVRKEAELLDMVEKEAGGEKTIVLCLIDRSGVSKSRWFLIFSGKASGSSHGIPDEREARPIYCDGSNDEYSCFELVAEARARAHKGWRVVSYLKEEGFKTLDRIESAVRGVLKQYLSNEYYEETKVDAYYIDNRNRVLVIITPNVTRDVPTRDENVFVRELRRDLNIALRSLGFTMKDWLEGETSTRIVLARVGV